MAVANMEDGSRVKPDDAESRSAMTTHRERGPSNGTNNKAGGSMLNPKSDIWVPKNAPATAPNVSIERPLLSSRGYANTWDQARIASADARQHGNNGSAFQDEKSNGQQATNGAAGGHVLLNGANGANGMESPGDVKTKGATGRVPVKARANTIGTAAAPILGSGFFEQATFNLLNETLRNGNGWKAGTP